MSQSYSNLFQGVSGGNSNWFSDWSSLRNGSYRRLMKSYYGNIGGSGSSVSGTTTSTSNVLDRILEERKNPQVSEEVQKANSSLTAGIAPLKNSVQALQNENTYTDSDDGKTTAQDKVVSAMKNFVSQYNDVVNAAKKSTLTGKTSHVGAMMRLSNENAEKLAEVGITINRNGTLMLNEGKLKSTDISKVQEMFSSEDIMSYGSSVLSRLTFASAAAGAAEKTETDNTENETAAASGAAGLKQDSETLASDALYEMIKGEDGTDQYDIDKIFATAKSFVNNYNKMFDAAKTSTNSGVVANLARIREKTAQNKEALAQFGISVDKNGKLEINEDTFKKSDMSQLRKFFKDYGSSIATNASLVDYYMTTQANSSNNYTSEGTYSLQGVNRFEDMI